MLERRREFLNESVGMWATDEGERIARWIEDAFDRPVASRIRADHESSPRCPQCRQTVNSECMIRRANEASAPPDLTVSPEMLEERRKVLKELAGSLSNEEADRIEAILKDMFGRPDPEIPALDRPCD